MKKTIFSVVAILLTTTGYTSTANASSYHSNNNNYYSMSCHELDRSMWSYEEKLEDAKDDADDADIDYIFADDDYEELDSAIDGAFAEADVDIYQEELQKIHQARNHKGCGHNSNNHTSSNYYANNHYTSSSYHSNSSNNYYSMSCHDISRNIWSHEAKLEDAKHKADDADIDYIFADDDDEELDSAIDSAFAEADIDMHQEELNELRQAANHKGCHY